MKKLIESKQEQAGASRSKQEQAEASRSKQEQAEASRSKQEQQGNFAIIAKFRYNSEIFAT